MTVYACGAACHRARGAQCIAEIATYITDGSGDAITYTPYFTYMGFRYAAVRALIARLFM